MLSEPRLIGQKFLQVPLSVTVPAGMAPVVMTGDPYDEGEIVVALGDVDVPEVRLRVHFMVPQ